MNEFCGCLFAFSMVVALPACTAPTDTAPGPQPIPTNTVPPAHGAPTEPGAITASWKAATERSFTMLAAATAGDEGAIAYAESDATSSAGGDAPTTLKLQRLDSAGATRGDAVELGVMASGEPSGLTIASDGSQYVVCWGVGAQIACTSVSVEQGGASPVVTMAGTDPALVHNAGTWALGYATAGQLAVVKLTSTGVAAGSPALFDGGEDSSWTQVVLLAGNKLGFVLVGGSDVRVQQLDFALAPVGGPVNLGVHPWGLGAIAASDTRVAINLAEPYGCNTFFLQGPTLLDKQAYGGGGKLGLEVALAAAGETFGMLSGAGFGGRVYRTLAPNAVPIESEVFPADEGNYDRSPRALLQLKGEMFLAVTNHYSRQEILVARVPQP